MTMKKPGMSNVRRAIHLGSMPSLAPRVRIREDRARRCKVLLGPERVGLNPDCGFATFADNPLASAEVAERKLGNIAHAARLLRDRHGTG